jgi:hypothetical protein
VCSCIVNVHLCGDPCKFLGRRGCQNDCTKVGERDSISARLGAYAQCQVLEHAEDEHMCSALVHMCGEVRFHLLWRVCVRSWLRQPCALRDVPGGWTLTCQGSCIIPRQVSSPILFGFRPKGPIYSDQEHDLHSCDMRLCPETCELCKRLCAQSHLHGLTPGAHHLCGSVCYTYFLLQTSS